ncbi:MAG TPA: hypothetical protein VFV24_04420, partial [Candidatus Eisenbacteria bacterium]|nr:hypothetical protein [Candidatus Eisenbacteria bacterium]
MNVLSRSACIASLAAAILLGSGCGGAGTRGGARPATIDPTASPASLVALADSAARIGDANLARRAL